MLYFNWRKLKKFIKSDYADNGINGKDRGYTHQEIKTILEYSDQRLKTAFLVLASTGMRVGALQTIRIGDLEKIDNLYKIIVYAGDNEEYFSFTTPECAKEIDSYLDYRTRRGEKITQDSCLFVRKFSSKIQVKGLPFKGKSLWAILEQGISNTGLREINNGNPLLGTQISMVLKMRAKKQSKFYKNCLTK
jgi:integrase